LGKWNFAERYAGNKLAGGKDIYERKRAIE